MKRKKKVLLILVSIILFCIWYWWMYVLFWSNALDRISYAVDDGIDGNLYCFERIKEAEECFWDEMYGGVQISYSDEYVKDNTFVGVYSSDKGNFKLSSGFALEEQGNKEISVFTGMSYDRDMHKLVLEPVFIIVYEMDGTGVIDREYYDKENIDQYLDQYNISEEDIRECQNYILYDVVVKTWTKAHGGLNFLERLKIGLCIEDHTFDFEYEE